MLLLLAQWLGSEVRAFNVFNYLTLRAVLAMATSLCISLLLGPAVIRKLTELKVGQVLSCENLPKSEKLLKMMVDLGEERPRQILAGIAKP